METVTLALCGDVMLGRGVDQILPCPGDPELWEPWVRDARDYVELAEAVNGPVPRPAGPAWPWGDALGFLAEAGVRVVNLETSITRDGRPAPGKSVHYRMNPGNLPALTVARPDVCALANNHVLDFGPDGLRDTLGALAGAGVRYAGAGRDAEEARRPAIVPAGDGTRVVVLSVGMSSSGIPPSWAAGPGRPGVGLVPEPSGAVAAEIIERVRRAVRPGDLVVVSIHWGSNWGYDVPPEWAGFARALIDGGVDIVHGHSSHHPRPIEIHRDRLILYGCGDLVNDYEGISGYEEYRDDLRLLYLASLDRGSGALTGLRLIPLRVRRLRLHRASHADTEWLRAVLDRICPGLRFRHVPGGTLAACRA